MARILDILLFSEIVDFNILGKKVPIIAFHIPDNTTSISFTEQEMGDYVLDNYSTSLVACSMWLRPGKYPDYLPDILSLNEHRETYDNLTYIYKPQINTDNTWFYTECAITTTSAPAPNIIMWSRDYSGYGVFAMQPFYVLCLGNGYDKICYGSNAIINLAGYITYTESPTFGAYDSYIPNGYIQPFGAPRSQTTIQTFNIVGTVNLESHFTPHSSDPYERGGTTDIGGGTGTFDGTTEPVPVPDIPTTSAVDTGFISLYNPSIAQLKALASYLWSPTGLDLDTFKKIFSDAMSAILGLSLIPLAPGAGTVESVILGNIDTGVTMPRISSQFIKYSCGSLTIEEYWGGYLDYSPYTSAEIYLPFIGVKPLSIDDIMGKTIAVWYLIDVLSGGCVACIDCAGSVLYQFIGQCACTIPVTGRDFSSVVNGVLGAIGSGVSGFIKGGISGGVLGAAGSLAGNVTSMKPHVEKSGNMGGMGGMLGVKTPYIILTRPKQALPANQNTYTGYPSYITSVLGECSGYTVVQDVHLTGFSATDNEKEEILRLLKEGVYL